MLADKEKVLLSHLRQNCRQSFRKISNETEIPTSTLFDVLKRLDNSVVKKHVTLLNFDKMGFGIRSIFIIKTKEREKMKHALAKHPNVNTMYKLTDNYNYYVEAIFSRMNDVFDFSDMIQKVGAEKVIDFMVIEELKVESMLEKAK